MTLLWGVVVLLPGRLPAETVNWKGYDGWQITSFKLEGVPRGLSDELQRGLALNGKWKLLRGQKRPAFEAKLLAADLTRIRLFLAARGYPAAAISPRVTARPDSRQLALVLVVTPGDPVRVGELNFSGWPAGVAVPDTSQHDFVQVGDVFADQAVRTGTTAIHDYLRNAGYAQAKVDVAVRPLGPGLVALDFTVVAGDFFVIDEVVVTGCSDDLKPLALRVINIKPGTEFAQELLTTAALDLRLTQLFQRVDLVVEAISPGHLRLRADLANGRMRSWEAAIGTWSNNPWMVRSSWTHRDIFGGGRGLNARGAFATHELKAGVGVFWLGWLSPRARTRVGVDVIAQREDAYDSQEFRAEAVQSFRPRDRDMLNVGSALSENRIQENIVDSGEAPEPQGRLWELWVDRKWDWTNDPLFPSRGGFLKLSATFAEPWVLSVVPYVSAQVDAAFYRPLFWGITLTGRTRLGGAQPIQTDAAILANRRFYAGGYNSHRGYERHGLGPRDEAGDSRGGEAVALFSGEVRMPQIWLLEAGFFVDSGNVWQTLSAAGFRDFPVAVGATVGLRSPLGPIRLGYAVNIADLVPGRSRELWHIGIGYPW